VSDASGSSYAFTVPPGQYEQLQIYATAAGHGGGQSELSYTLIYDGESTDQESVTVPDWCAGPLSGEFTLASVNRVQNGDALTGGGTCDIYAINLNPDPTQTLVEVSFTVSGSSTSNFVLYGATAW